MPTITGTAGPDVLTGSTGADAIFGAGGADTLTGGAGADTFFIAQGDSPTSAATGGHLENLVRITDWSNTQDKLVFEGEIAGSPTNTIGIQAPDIDTAISQSNSLFLHRAGTVFILAQIGTDTVVFDDQHEAVVLSNQNFMNFNFSGGIGDGSGVSPPPPPPPPPPTPVSGPGAYTFETITPGQALGYNSAVNSLSFTTAGSSALNLQVTFNAATATSGANVTLVSSQTGHSVVFGTGIYGETDFSFSDGSHMQIGAGGLESLTGGAGVDVIYGNSDIDVMDGGGGDDVLVAGGGDLLTGGAGNNLFLAAPGQSGTGNGEYPVVKDWHAGDTLSFAYVPGTAANFGEGTAPDGFTANAIATSQMQANPALVYFAVQSSDGVYVYADTSGQHTGLGPNSLVFLQGSHLGDISPSDIVFNSGLSGTQPTLPPPPPPPAGVNTPGSTGTISGNMEIAHLHDLNPALINVTSATEFRADGDHGLGIDLVGQGITYDYPFITGGTISHMSFTDVAGGATILQMNLSIPNIGAPGFESWLADDDINSAFNTILGGADTLNAVGNGTVIHAYAGNDMVFGNGGADSLYGGQGNDTIYANNPAGGPITTATTYLRGDEGDDSLIGGAGFDDINGNMGNDTVHGNGGDDYSVGGKDNDLLFGDDGDDIVWGNLGNDTCDGGNGDDQCRGGQGEDSIVGGAGNDFISGDRGSDTESGGAGADIFHTFADAGLDKVLDFNLAEGDRVMLDPGTTFTLRQEGADTVIDMGLNGQMILVGVQLSTLTPGWIFGA